jgi:hypothetical protein
MAEWSLGANGGLAEYLIVEAANARRIPDNMSLELAGKCDHHHAVIPKLESVEDSHCGHSSSRTVGRWMARRPHPCPSWMFISVGRRRRTDRTCHSPSLESTRC